MSGEPLTLSTQGERLSVMDQNLMDPVGLTINIRSIQWAVVGRERDWTGPCCLEVNWTLGPVDRNHHCKKAGELLLPLLFFLVISDVFGLVKTFSVVLTWPHWEYWAIFLLAMSRSHPLGWPIRAESLACWSLIPNTYAPHVFFSAWVNAFL